jgi:hypothetical protein
MNPRTVFHVKEKTNNTVPNSNFVRERKLFDQPGLKEK